MSMRILWIIPYCHLLLMPFDLHLMYIEQYINLCCLYHAWIHIYISTYQWDLLVGNIKPFLIANWFMFWFWHSELANCSYGFSSVRGKRCSMEDFYEAKFTVVEDTTVGLFGVFDGIKTQILSSFVCDSTLNALMY